jgi:mRNA interferase MazF
MKRGEVWTLAGGGDFVGKPRPVVILQDDRYEIASVTVCPLTTNPTEATLFRIEIEPTPENGLALPSRIMADKVTTVRRTRLGGRIGHLNSNEMAALGGAVLVFLGLEGDTGARHSLGEAAT